MLLVSHVKKLVLASYAKLNLFLQVTGTRKDGYHTLRTVFERISLSDTIRFSLRRDGVISVSSDSTQIPGGPGNLAWRSAALLKERYKCPLGADIHIEKRIPVGAGMGGGSSNAATVLKGLNKLWGIGAPAGELARLGAKIGADVPFFLHDTRFAMATGVGDKVAALAVPARISLWHVLVIPRVHVSTPGIYKRWDVLAPKVLKNKRIGLTIPPKNVKILNLALQNGDLSQLGESLFNSLQFVTERDYPSVSHIRKRLAQEGISSVLMSGSGPTVFTVAPTRRAAHEAAAVMRNADPSWQVFVVKTR